MVTNKLDTHVANTLIPSPTTAIADTGTTGHFLREATNNAPLIPAKPLHVKLPDGHLISSIGTTSINWTGLPHSATQAHVLPELNPHSLISIGILCNHDCTAIFNKHNLTITHNNYCILHRTHLPNGLWSLPLPSPQPQANALIPANTQKDLVQWLHAGAFSPSISTFFDAVEQNFFTTWLHLTPQIICRHLCTPIATIKGHLDQQWQRQRKPTVTEPPPSPLPTKSHSIYTAILDPHQSTGPSYSDLTG